MAAEAQVRGWCPSAWQPMASGDGLIVRVRPRQAALSRSQILALCEAAQRWGSGVIDVTNRANIQLRGVRESDWPELMEKLVHWDLVDKQPETESRRNILVAPDWETGDDTDLITRLLLKRLNELPDLPGKFGFAVDAGANPMVSEDPADIRIERGESGQLIVKADGRSMGTRVDSPEAAVSFTIRLAHWFVESGGHESGRMKRHHKPLPEWAPAMEKPASRGQVLALGDHKLGAVYGLKFGQVGANALRVAVESTNAESLRLTPWRRILFKGAKVQPLDDLLTDNQAPELTVDACPGAPHCEQGTVPTRSLAQDLAGAVSGRLHVSGCSKGCARRKPADTCIVGRDGRYDLIFRARADDKPDGYSDGISKTTGLTESQVKNYFGVE